MSEIDKTISLLTALAVVVAPIVTMILQQHYARRAREDALRAEAKTNNRLSDIKATGDKVHILVNNSMSLVLKELAEIKRWKANTTGAIEDIHAAEEAEKKSQEHEVKQSAVNNNE